MIIEYAPKNTPYYGGMSMDIITPCWTITDNKKPAKPYGLRVFKLIRILLNLYLVEAGGIEPPSVSTPPQALHAYLVL
jgi:hypothetical protein